MNDVLTELQDTKANLKLIISSISDDQFNTVPFEDSWTAGQVSAFIF